MPELLATLLLVLKAFAIFKVSFNSAIGLGASTASLSRLPTRGERPLPVPILAFDPD